METAARPSYLDRFLAVAGQFGSRPAVVEPDRIVSYDELSSLVRRQASAIVGSSSGPKVLIHLPQVAEAYAAMFAAGLTGRYYTTTNVAAPPERRRSTFEAFAPDVVITNAAYRDEARANAPDAVIVDVDSIGRREWSGSIEPHRLAYVMFTSGSTGKPKGVMISKPALSHYTDWIMEAMAVRPDDRWSQHPNIAFDLSVLDIFGALCGGACLVPITGADLLMPAHAIRRHRLTIWDSVPSVLTTMIKMRHVNERNFQSLRMLTFCGEPLQKMHLDAIFGARNDVVVHNTYGPTEATVSCTLVRLTAEGYEDACQSTVAIGDPIPDMEIELVGGDDVEGEIVISGPQLADGYWKDAPATARQFRRYGAGGKFGYFTGDWAQRAGRHVYFRRRLDTQVKIRGERIELDDINHAMMQCGHGFACSVLVDGQLHGVFECATTLPADEALAEALARHLPKHLVPQHFHAMAELPRNPNGKVDLEAVKARIAQAGRAGAADPAPAIDARRSLPSA